MTKEIVELLLGLLSQVKLDGADADIVNKAKMIEKARAELEKQLNG